MYTTTMTQPDPERLHEPVHARGRSRSKANKWQGRNITRWQSKEYDDAFKAAQGELDPVKRAALVHQDERPGHQRPGRSSRSSTGRGVRGVANKLVAALSGWDNDFWALQNWYREA